MRGSTVLYFGFCFGEMDDDSFSRKMEEIMTHYCTFKAVEGKLSDLKPDYNAQSDVVVAYALRDYILRGNMTDACIHAKDTYRWPGRISPTRMFELITAGRLFSDITAEEMALAQYVYGERGDKEHDRHIVFDVPVNDRKKYLKYIKKFGYDDTKTFMIQAMRTQFALDIGRFVTGTSDKNQVNNMFPEDDDSYDPDLWGKIFG